MEACGELAPAHQGVAHATELAFVFGNPRWLGPWPEYQELSERMMEMWIAFAHDGTPNNKNREKLWPAYGSRGEQGSNLVLQTEEQGELQVEGDTGYVAVGGEGIVDEVGVEEACSVGELESDWII